jgi:hypothetical protein
MREIELDDSNNNTNNSLSEASVSNSGSLFGSFNSNNVPSSSNKQKYLFYRTPSNKEKKKIDFSGGCTDK